MAGLMALSGIIALRGGSCTTRNLRSLLPKGPRKARGGVGLNGKAIGRDLLGSHSDIAGGSFTSALPVIFNLLQ